MKELVVVAAHGPDFRQQCADSLAAVEHIVVDTGPDGPAPGRHPTGAYLWAYRNTDADAWLFIQDSMTAIVPDPLPWFRDQMPDTGLGAVAWGQFAMAYDTFEQQQWVEAQYPDSRPPRGIMGPIFYTTRDTLDLLDSKNLLPMEPDGRIQAQGTERAWALAFHAAGLPVVGPMWDHGAMRIGFGPFRKVWAARP